MSLLSLSLYMYVKLLCFVCLLCLRTQNGIRSYTFIVLKRRTKTNHRPYLATYCFVDSFFGEKQTKKNCVLNIHEFYSITDRIEHILRYPYYTCSVSYHLSLFNHLILFINELHSDDVILFIIHKKINHLIPSSF